jgi:hypothetical protein
MSAFDQIREVYFGSSGMPLPLGPKSRGKLMLVSLAPAMVLAAAVIHAAISLTYSDFALSGRIFDSTMLSILNTYGDLAPEPVRRLYAVTEALQALEPLALALLFAAGLQRWSRAEGSWTRAIGVTLAGIALAAGAFAVGAYAVLDRTDDKDLHLSTWMSLAGTFGLMAIGYFFLAYRSANSPDGGSSRAAGSGRRSRGRVFPRP